jgi:oxygen-independent coproporphyrinogen-3 oxidase
MAGIYIHIPFCRKACHYCNFHFSTSLHQKPLLIKAIQKEIIQPAMPAGVQAERNIGTIYFGGGTPSILEIPELIQLMDAISKNYHVETGAEITLEANPDDINPAKLQAWKSLGINRLSIGVQSFADDDLRWMNRAHNALQAIECIQLAKLYGFHDLTIDLIYGTPTLTDTQWKKNVETAISLGINHLSCYALTVEERTALNHFIKKGKVPPVDEAKQSRHFDMLMKITATAGFEHYEISNFAKPGHRSKHNSNYWSGKAYYGFGPAAHSYNGLATRWWNIANNKLYADAIEKNEPAFLWEVLSSTERLNEIIMTGLRTMDGINIASIENYVFQNKIDVMQLSQFKQALLKFSEEGNMLITGDNVSLTKKGIHFADGIASALFF